MGLFFSKAKYRNGVGFEICTTIVPKLPPSHMSKKGAFFHPKRFPRFPISPQKHMLLVIIEALQRSAEYHKNCFYGETGKIFT